MLVCTKNYCRSLNQYAKDQEALKVLIGEDAYEMSEKYTEELIVKNLKEIIFNKIYLYAVNNEN